jgi:hypothetical protein
MIGYKRVKLRRTAQVSGGKSEYSSCQRAIAPSTLRHDEREMPLRITEIELF